LLLVKAPELIRNVITQVTVARTKAATLHEALSVLQSWFADQTAELRQSPADSRREQERKT
jgi:hypothetical protein